MDKLLVPFAIAGLLASPVAGVLACSRAGLQPAILSDAASDREDGSDAGDASLLADLVSPAELAGPSSGDGQLDRAEAGGDGNALNGDGCGNDCKVDYCATCGSKCPGCAPRQQPQCGNGIMTSEEACDDGNTKSGDGCSADCKSVEAGFRCPRQGKLCVAICGDGLIIGGETCDDGNTISGDGCSSICQTEPDNAVCGDGITTPDEECDCGDGSVPAPDWWCVGSNDDNAYGGCTTSCTWGPSCGDGIVNGPEACDLGKRNGSVDGPDGCTIGCRKPRYCGDGVADTDLGEECDLGDRNGKRLDGQGIPSDSPDASVWCYADCTFPEHGYLHATSF